MASQATDINQPMNAVNIVTIDPGHVSFETHMPFGLTISTAYGFQCPEDEYPYIIENHISFPYPVTFGFALYWGD